MLSSMAGADFPVTLDRHVALGLRLATAVSGGVCDTSWDVQNMWRMGT